MEWVETTGRTIDEAKDAALDQLGVDETDAEFVIVAEPRPGLFGRMRGEARVRARVAPTSPRPKRGRTRRQDQRRSGGRSRANGGGDRSTGGGVAVADGEDADTEVSDDSGRGTGPSSNGARQAGATPGGSGPGSRRRRSRGGRGRGGSGRKPSGEQGSGEEDDGRATRPAGNGNDREAARSGRPRAADGGKEEPVGEELSLEEQGETAREFIAGLVEELGLEAQISMKVVDEDTVEVAVDGESLGILIGPGGATLGALQELARTVVQKRTGGHSDRILVDVAGYRARRAEALQRFTRQIAEEVLASGTERALEPMSAADRKVVHDTVNELAGVRTRSEGEDPRRHIVISPVADDAGEEPTDG